MYVCMCVCVCVCVCVCGLTIDLMSKVQIKGKVEQTREWSSTLPYSLV